MGIFSRFRKRGDVIDFTELQRRGLLKVPKIAPDYIEIKKPSSSTSQEQGSPFGFFGAIASSTPQETETSHYNNSSDSNKSSYLDNTLESRKERLRRRFTDMQDKLERASSEIYDLKHRLELIEKKLDRIERRDGIKTY